jgi:hypothetical protein
MRPILPIVRPHPWPHVEAPPRDLRDEKMINDPYPSRDLRDEKMINDQYSSSDLRDRKVILISEVLPP